MVNSRKETPYCARCNKAIVQSSPCENCKTNVNKKEFDILLGNDKKMSFNKNEKPAI